MHAALFRAILIGSIAACGVWTAGCYDDESSTSVQDATLDVEIDGDMTKVMQGDRIPLHVIVDNVYLTDPAKVPPVDRSTDAGHIRVYLDDVASEPLLVTARTDLEVEIGYTVKPGEHTLKLRVYTHDGAPTSAALDIPIFVNAKPSSGH